MKRYVGIDVAQVPFRGCHRASAVICSVWLQDVPLQPRHIQTESLDDYTRIKLCGAAGQSQQNRKVPTANLPVMAPQVRR